MAYWLLEVIGPVGYDAYEAKLIKAKTEEEARKIANYHVGEEGPVWQSKYSVTCEKLNAKRKDGLVIASFCAG